ncbi:hypothetical protein A2Z33_07620 [Candidatus Gottesmanbacteria bacterium RBG_16_52_11]|uniref:Uncharacterized protein n=1 Tax=Candidatus Gottesmanbacteria bacterium RBG_16_52_11 TaxID=1798374 RepID=A0A1F5YNU2_9BACT|nr:MAG: hypothetical protein A2Z33_07620 [Candidatus Gottesmanbacteria bacterium RBG_16_52_11]
MAAQDIIGTIDPILPTAYRGVSGIGVFIVNILRLVFVVAGIYSFFNFILAGFAYMTAAGDPKKLQMAWAKIWQSLVGLLIIIVSFALAAVIGYIMFGRVDFILNPIIYTPD